ncbi:cation:proton antiporter [Streptococcus macacae]|uniref:Transporter, CPA2 family n=1 Tax=Streptococcus macacae NCTC 11558 TaxID=764298 RepID=G5JYA2_9STRE|nr:sodium:proton antiporter [Streptococcus macacae]EHJ52333.1 transporter, CPA2 family [Streptococcus macacae NCTC 11558]SUN78016.1 NhaP-type Na+/H+ and K+/H+ antiporter [Streptococcus macacae NCTC 11558]
MEHLLILIYCVAILLALLLSNILSKLFPKIPLQMIQVILGIVISFLTQEHTITMDPELFLSLVIAPLLFREGEESDITNVMRHWRMVLYLVFPVILATTLSVGWLANILLPVSIPLAAWFAVGAALGPTDAVAFASLSQRFEFPRYIQNILKGEGLLNDASGLVAFQVAILALTTGEFSALEASFELIWVLIGGFLVGLLFSTINRSILALLENTDISDVTSSILLELILPLLSYFVAEQIHASGIIAVVVAGILQASRFKRITLLDARIDSVTDTVWRTISFILNGLVFILLGTELIRIVKPVLTGPTYSNLRLIVSLLAIVGLIFTLRFIMISLFYWIRLLLLKKRKPFKSYVKDVLILTFSGVKGTVSIATILLVSSSLAKKYPLMLFVVAGVTLISFVTGILLLPRLTKPKVQHSNHLMEIAILGEVVAVLEEEVKTAQNKGSYYAAIDNYQNRIKHLILDAEDNNTKSDLASLQALIIQIEGEGLEKAFDQNKISIQAYRLYQRYLNNLERDIDRGFISSLSYALLIFGQLLRLLLRELLTFGRRLRKLKGLISNKQLVLTAKDKEAIKTLYFDNTAIILDSLEQLEGVYDGTLIDYLQDARLREAEILNSDAFIDRVITRLRPNNIKEMLRGYQLERDAIFRYEEDKRITQRQAKQLRENVNRLEDYSLKEKANTLPYDMINYRRQINQ